MTKEKFEELVKLYIKTEQIIIDLKRNWGIDFTNSQFPNFYNNYNYLIHKLFIELFGEKNTNLIESKLFDLNKVCNIDELYDIIYNK